MRVCMKCRELEAFLKENGCYDTGEEQAGHPLWFSPKTKKHFQMSHHKSKEVAAGTLNKILKSAGLK